MEKKMDNCVITQINLKRKRNKKLAKASYSGL